MLDPAVSCELLWKAEPSFPYPGHHPITEVPALINPCHCERVMSHDEEVLKL